MHTLVLNADSAPISLVPLSTIGWKDAVRAMYIDSVAVVAEYDEWTVHSPSVEIRVPSVIMTKRYLHYQRRIQFSDTNLFLRDRYTCQYCYKVFPATQLTMDHVLPVRYGGKTTWDNITTACGPCNFRKGSNKSIVPKIKPRQPSYYELLNIRKEYPIVVPCESWVDYLDWPVENIRFNKKILHI
jgi:5-methylcytosine-specific restriction endonuclease McrA